MAEDFNIVWDNQPPAPIGSKVIGVSVVAKRCVYLNNYRIAGGKPWHAENLPSHELKTSLAEVLSAFSEADVLAALAERKARREYFAAYHERKKADEAVATTAAEGVA